MIIVLIVLLLLFAPSYAQAAEESFFSLNLVWSIVNFIILVAGFVYLYKRFQGKNFFKSRKEKIEKLINEAMETKRNAMSRHEEVTKQLSQFDSTNKEIMDDMTARAEQEKRAILDEGQVLLERLKKEGERIVDAEVQKAKEMISDHIRSQLYELSKDYIEKSIDTNDQQKVTDKFIRKIK